MDEQQLANYLNLSAQEIRELREGAQIRPRFCPKCNKHFLTLTINREGMMIAACQRCGLLPQRR